jgi:polyisoprenoid-binding protein YceI
MAAMSKTPVTQPSSVTGSTGTGSTVTGSPAPGQLPPGRYRIDAGRSTVTFTTRHLFGLAPVRGTFALRDGTVHVADPVTGSTVRARVAAATFQSGSAVRDAAVLSPKLLDATACPSLTFTSTGFAPAEGEAGQWQLRGALEVRGVTRPVEARVTVAPATNAGPLRASAQLTVDRYAFGITAFRGLAARWLTVDLEIVAELAELADRDAVRTARS